MQVEGLRQTDVLSEGKVGTILTLLQMKLLPTTGDLRKDATNLLSKHEFAFTDAEIEYWLEWFGVK